MMRSREEVQQVHDKALEENPEHDDEDLDLIIDVLSWVLGYDESSAGKFIEDYIGSS
jgi:hypothetical protein